MANHLHTRLNKDQYWIKQQKFRAANQLIFWHTRIATELQFFPLATSLSQPAHGTHVPEYPVPIRMIGYTKPLVAWWMATNGASRRAHSMSVRLFMRDEYGTICMTHSRLFNIQVPPPRRTPRCNKSTLRRLTSSTDELLRISYKTTPYVTATRQELNFYGNRGTVNYCPRLMLDVWG